MHLFPIEKYVPLRVCRYGNYVPGAGEGGDAARRERLRVRRGHHDKRVAGRHRQGREKAQPHREGDRYRVSRPVRTPTRRLKFGEERRDNPAGYGLRVHAMASSQGDVRPSPMAYPAVRPLPKLPLPLRPETGPTS